jgi:putative ABC transport system permease protein
MNGFAFVSFYRSLVRHKLYAALNIGGLAVGIAVFIVLGLYVRFETSYETFLPHHQQAYLLKNRWTLVGVPTTDYDGSMGGLLEQLHQDFPETVGTRMKGDQVSVLRNGVATSEQAELVDPSFFDVLDVPVIAGDARAAVRDPGAVLLSQKIARKYFPGDNAIGKRMTFSINGVARDYRVAAILKDAPRNTELDWDIVTKLVPNQLGAANWYHWGSGTLNTYLRFATPADAAAYARRLPSFIDRRGAHDMSGRPSETLSFPLVPIRDVHLSRPGSKLTATTLGLVGLLTLLIAIINYVNLATARAGLRAREVAMRKVLGGSRSALVRHFLGEAIATAAVAAVIGLALAELALPVVNAAGDLSLSIDYAVTIPALVVLALVVGLGAGLYPALMLSRFPAAAVLASARSPGGGRTGTRLREGLVMVQFALAIAFLIGTAVLFAQTLHVRSADIGFQREGMMVVKSFGSADLSDPQRASLLAAYRSSPSIVSATIADAAPGDGSFTNANQMHRPGQDDKDGPNITTISVGKDWFETYNARLAAGRFLDTAHRQDDLGTSGTNPVNVVINRTAVPLLGFASPQAAIGQTVIESENAPAKELPRVIVGVIDDIRFYAPREKMTGMMFRYSTKPFDYTVAVVRYRGSEETAMQALRDSWRQIAPQVPFEATTANRNLARYYKPDDRAARLFAIGAGLAVAIGCVGLWGLASFNTQRRVKEVGIRKTLGASSTDIVKLLVGQFLRPVLIANVVAWPLAFVAMRTWLAGFDDRIALSPLYFVGATAVSLLIAVGTVIAQSLRAARAAPAWALRHE